MQFLRATLLAGLAGWAAIDIYLAITIPFSVPGATAIGLFQWDASNFLGAAAFREGWSAVLFGLAADLVVSLIWAAIFVLLASRIPSLETRPIIAGALFGVLVMLVMIYVVVPLGAAHAGAQTLKQVVNNLVAHTIFFGIPLAYVAQKTRTPRHQPI